jgi:hypothetical protein
MLRAHRVVTLNVLLIMSTGAHAKLGRSIKAVRIVARNLMICYANFTFEILHYIIKVTNLRDILTCIHKFRILDRNILVVSLIVKNKIGVIVNTWEEVLFHLCVQPFFEVQLVINNSWILINVSSEYHMQ